MNSNIGGCSGDHRPVYNCSEGGGGGGVEGRRMYGERAEEGASVTSWS